MSAADDEDLIGMPEPDGFTTGELYEVILNLPRPAQEELFARAIRKEPTIVGGLLVPELDDPGRLDANLDVQRLVHKDAVSADGATGRGARLQCLPAGR